MKRIGLCWLRHWRSNVRFGRKTQTFSEQASRRGPRIVLSCCFERGNRMPTNRILNEGAAGPSRPHRFSRRLERRAVVGSVFTTARVVGALDAIELRDAVRFAFPNSALH